MKRDMDLIRKLAIYIESSTEQFQSGDIVFEGYSDKEIGYHCGLMAEAGLINFTDISTLSSEYPEMFIFSLTWYGHDFVDAAKNETIWNKVTGEIKTRATAMTFDSLMEILSTYGQRLVQHGADWMS